MALRHAASGGLTYVTPDGERIVEPSAMALAAAFAGLSVGVFFLSFTYHYVLWIYIGLSGALYSNVRKLDASFRVIFGWRDLLLVASADAIDHRAGQPLHSPCARLRRRAHFVLRSRICIGSWR